MTKNIYGINNKNNGVVRMYVTTSVTYKAEVRIDLLTFMQIMSNFALEQYSKLCAFYKLIRKSQYLPNFHAFRCGQLCLE